MSTLNGFFVQDCPNMGVSRYRESSNLSFILEKAVEIVARVANV